MFDAYISFSRSVVQFGIGLNTQDDVAGMWWHLGYIHLLILNK